MDLKKYRYPEYKDFTPYKIYEIKYQSPSFAPHNKDGCAQIKGICLPKQIDGYICLFEIKEDQDGSGVIKDRYLYDSILIRIKDVISYKELDKSMLYFCNQNDDRLSKKNKDLAKEIFCMYSENKIA
jgi:hypothetical protein